MPFSLMSLPYEESALEPYISAKTLHFHHGAHHKGYVDALNALVDATPYAQLSLEEVITAHADTGGSIFNNAAQVWNHDFYWKSLTPGGSTLQPSSPLHKAIIRDFQSLQDVIEALIAEGIGQFGSGWCWLVTDENGNLSVTKTPNAQTPWVNHTPARTPLLVCDVWEHAYYLDYQNKRATYIRAVLENCLNWGHAEAIYNTTLGL